MATAAPPASASASASPAGPASKRARGDAGNGSGGAMGGEKEGTAPPVVGSAGSGQDAKERLLASLRKRDGHKRELVQAAEEIIGTLLPVLERDRKYVEAMERLLEPERVIQFRVAWQDDAGVARVNRGWRIQANSALGPYKGGLRFHPTVTDSVLGFLALEQILKNSLTGLPMGGAKGGSDFDPKGKSDAEVQRFCQSFMTALAPHIGANVDVPAGDIGVGAREVGFLFGQFKRLSRSFEGALTGKGASWGGSQLRPEATGYGLVFFALEALKALHSTDLKGKTCCVTGSGNVALYAVERLIKEGAKVLTVSDSNGYIYEPDGITEEGFAQLRRLKEKARGRLSEFKTKTVKYVEGKKPWGDVPCEFAFPCATQNEVTLDDVKGMLAHRKLVALFEGANMPCENDAIAALKGAGVLFGPAKACNAGGVAVSGLEMAQDSIRMYWTRQEIEDKLRGIMANIFKTCCDAAKEYGKPSDLQAGANLAGFLRVADAMIDQGLV